jgi:uncharacterized membrane protein (DUF4010 family)
MLWVFIFNKKLIAGMYPALGIILLTAIGVTMYFYFKENRKKTTGTSMPLGKPLNLAGAFFFGILYTVIVFLIAIRMIFLARRALISPAVLLALRTLMQYTISVSKLAIIQFRSIWRGMQF